MATVARWLTIVSFVVLSPGISAMAENAAVMIAGMPPSDRSLDSHVESRWSANGPNNVASSVFDLVLLLLRSVCSFTAGLARFAREASRTSSPDRRLHSGPPCCSVRVVGDPSDVRETSRTNRDRFPSDSCFAKRCAAPVLRNFSHRAKTGRWERSLCGPKVEANVASKAIL